MLRNTLIVIVCLGLFTLTPFYQVLKSYAVMSVYSKAHELGSFLHDEDISIKMPGGLSTFKKDYYPFVMTYDTSTEYSERLNTDVDLVVLYNFGAMNWLSGSSLMYDVNSPYYSSFYGAYAARYNELERQYGIDDSGEVDIAEIMEVTNFDLKVLVMESIGNQTPEVDYEVTNEDEPNKVEIDGILFDVYDATIFMDGMMHEYRNDYMAYIQYGRPPQVEKPINSFEKIEAYGRIYVYFDYDTAISYFFYIIAPTMETIEETQKNFIIPSKLKGIN